MIEWMPVLSKVIETVLVVLLPPLAVAFVGWVVGKARLAWAQVKKWNPTIADKLLTAVEFAVKAAEQAGAANLIKDKKAYAIQIAETYLTNVYHMSIDIDLIDAAIEAAVGELFSTPVEYEIEESG